MKDKVLKRIIRKRTFNNFRSRLKKKIRNGVKLTKSVLKHYHLHNVKQKLYLQGINRPKNRKTIEINIPGTLSLLEAPKATISFLSRLKKILSDNIHAFDIFINHENTNKISTDASFLFDKLINEYVERWKTKRIKIKLSGRASKNRDVNNFLLSFGFYSYINIIAKQLCPSFADIDYKKHFIIFRKNGDSRQPHLAGNACTELTDFFDRCFNENGFIIIDEAKSNLVDTFGEIIKNAEEHSGSDSQSWSIIGCYSRKDHNCSFSIINYGRTFYEALSSNESTAANALSEIDDILISHLNVFKKITIDKKLYVQNIWTMMALQDGISSKRTQEGKASTRGQGMMDIISFIDGIRNKNNKSCLISIISGYTNISIDFTFNLVYKAIKKTTDVRRMMIFNAEQNLHMPPDKKFINNINDKFDGVIISGTFTIDSIYLIKKLKGV